MTADEARTRAVLAAGYVTGRMLDDPGVTLIGGDPDLSTMQFRIEGVGIVTLRLEAAEPIPPDPPRRPSPTCRMCGKDEGDDVGVIIDGVCGICMAAWA